MIVLDPPRPSVTATSPDPAEGLSRRRRDPALWWIGTATVFLCLLQILAIDERNPLTRTLSSYEYTAAGWLFPVALVLFAVGIGVLAVRLDPALRAPRRLLAAAAGSSLVTAAFPAGDGSVGQPLWPGEFHRWGSIALMVFVLSAALALLRRGLPTDGRPAVVRLVTVGSVAGLIFMAGQLMPRPHPLIAGYAPLAGGLTQRILVGAVAAVLMHLAVVTARRGSALGV